MPGLEPGISGFARLRAMAAATENNKQGVDGRIKSGHDGMGACRGAGESKKNPRTEPGVSEMSFAPSAALRIQEAAQLAAAARMLELAERLRLDLADALAGDRELLADLFQRVVGVHADAEAHAQHALLAGGERSQDAGRGLAQIGLDGGIERQDGVLVLDEVAEMAILLVADRR